MVHLSLDIRFTRRITTHTFKSADYDYIFEIVM